MPIEVHCPNPECARVHLVKNKYAGMRGKCPVCASWMYVPALGMMPSMVGSRPEGLEEAASLAGRASGVPVKAAGERAGSTPRVVIEEEPPEPPRKQRARPRAEDEGVAEPGEAAAKPAFSKLPIFLLILGMLSLGAVSAAPFLAPPEAKATGDIEHLKISQPVGIDKEKSMIVAAAPGPVVLLALLALMMGLALRQWTFLPIALTYIAALLVAGGVFMVAMNLQADMERINSKIPKEVEKLTSSGRSGGFEASLGQQLPVAACGVAGAGAFFLLAAMAMHRRWWARVLCFIILSAPMVVLGVWAFHKELGIDVPPPPIA